MRPVRPAAPGWSSRSRRSTPRRGGDEQGQRSTSRISRSVRRTPIMVRSAPSMEPGEPRTRSRAGWRGRARDRGPRRELRPAPPPPRRAGPRPRSLLVAGPTERVDQPCIGAEVGDLVARDRRGAPVVSGPRRAAQLRPPPRDRLGPDVAADRRHAAELREERGDAAVAERVASAETERHRASSVGHAQIGAVEGDLPSPGPKGTWRNFMAGRSARCPSPLQPSKPRGGLRRHRRIARLIPTPRSRSGLPFALALASVGERATPLDLSRILGPSL